MDSLSADNLILEEGKSEELNQAFQLLRDATDPHGSPRYGNKVCRELARIVVCRTYSPALLELSYLIGAVMDTDPTGRYEGFFWGVDRATSAAFKASFQMNGDGGVTTVRDQDVFLNLGSEGFGISYSRMPVLAALLEFLMTTLGYEKMDGALAPIQTDGLTQESVGNSANELSRALYAYLKDHLPTVQVQKRNRSMMEFLGAQSDGQLHPDGLTDELVLTYWLACSTEEDGTGLETKTFSRVFFTAVRLTRVLRTALERLELQSAQRIGSDREAGEVDPAEVEDMLRVVDETSELLGPFQDGPLAAVKFLNGKEQDTLSDVAFERGVGDRFPVSVLRNAVFGRAQSKITNGLRRKVDKAAMARLIETAADEDYDHRLAAYTAMTAHLRRLKIVCFAVLVEQERPEAFDLAIDLAPNADLSSIRDALGAEPEWEDETVVSFQARSAMRRIFTDIRAGKGPLAELFTEGEKTLKSIARQGFRAEDRVRAEVIRAFALAPAQLNKVESELTRFTTRTDNIADWAHRYSEDAVVFRDHFKRIYGASAHG